MSATSHRVQMRWQDIDGLGHVNHVVALTYLEEGRDVFLEQRGISREGYVVGRCALTYIGEIEPDAGEVTVECELLKLGNSSLTTAERILDAGGEVIVEGEFGLVLWDPERRGSRPFTDAERAAFADAGKVAP